MKSSNYNIEQLNASATMHRRSFKKSLASARKSLASAWYSWLAENSCRRAARLQSKAEKAEEAANHATRVAHSASLDAQDSANLLSKTDEEVREEPKRKGCWDFCNPYAST